VRRVKRTGTAVRRAEWTETVEIRAARTGAAVRRDGEDRNCSEKG